MLKLKLIETFEDKLPPLSELELGYLENKPIQSTGLKTRTT